MTLADRYGPWAIVAGASEGTGQAIARRLAAESVSLVLIARRPEPLIAQSDELKASYGVKCVWASIDLGDDHAFERIVEAAAGREIGIYVSNAGADPNGSRFLDRDLDKWTNLTNINVSTTVKCCHYFGRRMRDRGRGAILIMNSYAAYGGGELMACYTGGKAFQLCFAESLWAELKPHGVDVLTFVMSMTDTPMLNTLLHEKGLPQPPGLASADGVAAMAIGNLANGPVQNWGLAEDQSVPGQMSAADRRTRTQESRKAASAVFGD
jgi:uncharacterized protein